MSTIAPTHLGAKTDAVKSWAAPLFEAYCAGAWMIYFTDETLFWIAKPKVHVERLPNGVRRLHRADGPACESDVEPLYFWRGILVPEHAVMRPEEITVAEVRAEVNAETRRVLRERMGLDRWLSENNAVLLDHKGEDYPVAGVRDAKLWRMSSDGDGEMIYVDMRDMAVQADGSRRRYFKRIMRPYYNGHAWKDAHAAIASTWREPDDLTVMAYADWRDYAPAVET